MPSAVIVKQIPVQMDLGLSAITAFHGTSHIKQGSIIQCAEDCEEVMSSWRKSWPSISKSSEIASAPNPLYIVGAQ